MTNEEILEGLKEVVKMVKPKIDLDGVTGNTLLVEELGLDSLTRSLPLLQTKPRSWGCDSWLPRTRLVPRALR